MHNGAGQPFTYTSRDMLDSTRVLHGYRYDDVPPVIRGAMLESTEGGLESVTAETENRRQPELAGANEGPLDITGGNRTLVSMAGGSLLESTAESPVPSKVYLNLENVTGRGANGNFHVYIDMPGDDREPVFVGILSTFGVERASKSDNPHGGSGISQVFDISETAGELGINSGTVDQLRVTFEPVEPPEQAALESAGADDTDDGEGDLPDAVAEFLGPQLESVAGERVQVGRVSLFVE
jgi:tyrosinase